jgi:imidazolonepropionase-like amidohydrolase
LLLASAAAAIGVPTPARAADVLYVKAAHLIIDASQPEVSPGALVITDGVVTAVGTNIQVPAGARTIDLGSVTIMPSLVDAHTHLEGGAPKPQPDQPTPLATPAYAALQAQHKVAAALSLGVAAMRVLGAANFVDVSVKNAIDDGVIPGPHLITAGHALSVPGGRGDLRPLPYTFDMRDFYTPLNGFVSSPADTEKAVQLQIKYGARVIKLLASGGVGSPLDSPADEHLTFEEMRIAVEQAHVHHLKAAAHAENLQAIMDAMRAGVDSIEHGSDLNLEAVDYMKSHRIVLVPTVSVVAAAHRPAPPGAQPYSRYKATQLAEKQEASFALALQHGVTIAAGSDSSYPAGNTDVIAEVVSEVEHGMSPRQALVSATLHGASLLGLNKLGTLATGMEGDFIAMDGDPLTNIHAIENVKMVVFKGKIVTDKTKPMS